VYRSLDCKAMILSLRTHERPGVSNGSFPSEPLCTPLAPAHCLSQGSDFGETCRKELASTFEQPVALQRVSQNT
jgi:hypothetical protein